MAPCLAKAAHPVLRITWSQFVPLLGGAWILSWFVSSCWVKFRAAVVSGFLTNNFGLAGFLPWGWASGQGFISPQKCTGFRMSCLAHLRGFCYPIFLSPVTLITSFCVQYELPGHGLVSSEAFAGVKVASDGDWPRAGSVLWDLSWQSEGWAFSQGTQASNESLGHI